MAPQTTDQALSGSVPVEELRNTAQVNQASQEAPGARHPQRPPAQASGVSATDAGVACGRATLSTLRHL